MESRSEPIGYFLTWTVYGTFLQGDIRWWQKKGTGSHRPRPFLEQWHRDRLKYDIVLLSHEHREIVRAEIEHHCSRRDWDLLAVSPRTNHVHVVVSAGVLGVKVRDQLKANCTRGVREIDARLVGRPVWTVRGDVQKLWTDEELDLAIVYVSEAQDRMERWK